jgi:hypothetical protein
MQVFDKHNGTFLRKFGSIGTKDGQLQYPDGIVVDNGSVFVVDQSNHRVQVRFPHTLKTLNAIVYTQAS